MRVFPIGVVLSMSVACMSGSAPMGDYAAQEMEAAPMADGAVRDTGVGKGAGAAVTIKKDIRRALSPRAPESGSVSEDMEEEEDRAEEANGEGEREARSWFPESFLWQPLVETDAQGVAKVPMRVPDQLTTWRVLALAHSREGSQSGTVHTFDSRLPLYVDPVVPAWLHVGDQLQLPVQAVNTTDAPLEGRVQVLGSEALSGAAEAPLRLDAGGSQVVHFPLVAVGAGGGTVRAEMSAGRERDAAERVLPVLPVGRPVQSTRAGTLTDERTWSMAGPADADPVTQELSVMVFPGPLSVLQAEVDRLAGGAVPPDGAYGFALAESLVELGAQAGVEADPKVVRRLRLLSWQRVVKAARAPSPGIASDLLMAIGEQSGFELADALRPRLIAAVEGGQRGDGSWARKRTGRLSEVLVQTAYAARALPESAAGSRLRAAGALERFGRDVDDPYTAAVMLGSGLLTGDRKEQLRALVIEGAVPRANGAYTVVVPSTALNPWGHRPTQAEMLAWTLLALEGTEVPWRGDLVAELMGGWNARYGFGAGAADVLALEAVMAGLPGVSTPVEVILTVGGVERARAVVDPAQPKVPAILLASTDGRARDIALRAEPSVPGLAFVATLDSWVPWTGTETMEGVDVEVTLSSLAVGRQATLTVALSAPSSERITLVHGLPAGVVVDEAALAGLSSMLDSHEVSTDRVRLTTRPFAAGEVMTLELKVQPSFAGQFTTLPLTLRRSDGSEVALPPVVWDVSRGEGS